MPLAGEAQPASLVRWGRVGGRRGPQGKREVEERVAAQGLAQPSTPRPWSSPTRTRCRPRPPWAPGSAWSFGFPAGEVWGDPDTADGVPRTPACPPRTRGQVGAAGPRDSLSPEGQLGAGLWETAPPLCSWGVSVTVAPSGTWRGGEQRLGSVPGCPRGGSPAPAPTCPAPCSVVGC